MVCRVVVSALQVVEVHFLIVVIAAIAQGVPVCKRTGGCQDRSVGVIGVACHCRAGGIDQINDVALQIQNVVVQRRGGSSAAVRRGQVKHIRSSALVVQEIQRIGRAVFDIAFLQQLAGGIGVLVLYAAHLFHVRSPFPS